MDYQQCINFLFHQLPMYQNIGSKAIKKDLTNIKLLCQKIGDPQINIPCIHIAGTNGKGTTAHMIAAILQKAGLKVGLYTSPHYEDFRERIKVNGRIIDEDSVIKFVNKIKKEVEFIQASFFEITVSMAFDFFRRENVDISVIETGLGGTLDSTNIVDPLLSVITNISLDHIGMLGSNRYQIAKAKAGIIKQDKPVVIGRYQASCDHIFLQKAKLMNSSISFASLNWNVHSFSGGWNFINTRTQNNITVNTDDNSPFIEENIKTTLEAIYRLRLHSTLPISEKNIIEGLNDFRSISNYKGRWEILSKKPLIIADSAHNQAALKTVLENIKSIEYKRCHFILGFVKDKDLSKILSLFENKHLYYFTCPSIQRGLPAIDLKRQALLHGFQGLSFEHVRDAINHVLSIAEKEDLIYIGGSSFVVADALKVRNEFFPQ